MRATIFHLDSFTTRLFGGNPAAVVAMEAFPADSTLGAIAAENNLLTTAFLVRQNTGYRLRWHVGGKESSLCGHGTLAAAAVVIERLEPDRSEITFHTASGLLHVRRVPSGYAIDFPAIRMAAVDTPAALATALGAMPAEVFEDADRYLALFDNEELVREMRLDMAAVARLNRHGVIVTARGSGDFDIVSRFFCPSHGIPEDQVTGSAHCALAPWWSERLGTAALRALQASSRGEEMTCRVHDGRVELEGRCVFYLEGQVQIGSVRSETE
jgi:PhzF family phenazine biosynthesis protein